MSEEFDKYWNNLTEEQRDSIKELVIARIKRIPPNLRISIG